jgi:cathepsin B
LKKLCGTRIVSLPKTNEEINTAYLPESFDSRTEWPNYIHPIRNQQQCGSCWAFGASEALSDRFAIASKGAINVVLSPEDLVECDNTDYGCNGGYLQNAFAWMTNHGIASDKCEPYTSGSGRVGSCPSKCSDGSSPKYYKCKAGTTKYLGTPSAIKNEIYQSGPVETAFTVYQDFMNYKSGIYVHTSGSQLGGHAVKIIGWGVENGTNYWLVANSWGTSWGLSGFFKIKEGQCGIDSDAIACTPAI